jgi:hypothetical protein
MAIIQQRSDMIFMDTIRPLPEHRGDFAQDEAARDRPDDLAFAVARAISTSRGAIHARSRPHSA